jgi:hypothetical protein
MGIFFRKEGLGSHLQEEIFLAPVEVVDGAGFLNYIFCAGGNGVGK